MNGTFIAQRANYYMTVMWGNMETITSISTF